MCDQNNLKDKSVTNLKFKGLMCYKINQRTNLLQTSNLNDP